MRKEVFPGLCLLAILSLAGCTTFLDAALSSAVGAAGEKVGERVGERVGTVAAGYADATLRNLTPGLMQAYVTALFSATFYHGGYYFDSGEYKPGEWTRWRATGVEEGEDFEKAFLAKLKDGNEWWQIVARSVREGEEEEVIVEALFKEPQEGYRELLRMRVLFPGDEEPAEIPVQEQEGAWYSEPVELTEESLSGAKKGKVKITVPGGSFNAEHVVFRDITGTAEWWLAPQVPGGIVRYVVTESAGEGDEPPHTYTAELVDFGKKAESHLGSF
jgi:hypothetical protein